MRVPHVFALLTMVIAAFSLLTWVVPSGSFARQETTVGGLTRNLVVPGSYEVLEKHRSLDALLLASAPTPEGMAAPVGLRGFLTAIPRGLEQSADIIFFIFVMGAVFGILRETGTINASLNKLMEVFAGSTMALIVVVTVLMGIGGSTLGMGEEFIPLVPIFLLLSQRLGYDRLFGLSIVILGGSIGFAAATTNPFTVNIAQGIAELPLNSGWRFRMVFFAFAMTLTLVHILRYGARVRRDPSTSLVADVPAHAVPEATEIAAFSRRHLVIVATSALVFAGILYGVQASGWWLADMGGGFLLMGLLAAAIGGLSMQRTTTAAVRGMEEMVVAALVVGVARGVVVVMTDGQILDTLVLVAARSLEGFAPTVGAIGMLLFQTVLNFFIPSGSGQAAVTMPIMAPLADLLGITRQTAVFAFQCGDGFANIVIPTSGTLMAMLLMADVPYDRWMRFVLPLFAQLLALSAIFVGIAVAIGYA